MATAENLYKAGYRKIPENAVVIPKEISYYENIEKRVVTAKLYGERVDFTPEQIMSLTTIFHHKELQEKEIRKETAEKFAERLKEKCIQNGSKNPLVGCRVTEQEINEIRKEITEGGNDL